MGSLTHLLQKSEGVQYEVEGIMKRGDGLLGRQLNETPGN